MSEDASLFSKRFRDAVASIQTRAERMDDHDLGQTLRSIFVDHGLLIRITNNRNQIVSGRRGSGKTHLLLALEKDVKSDNGLFIYVDLIRLSSGLTSGMDTPQAIGRKWFFSLTSFLVERCLEEVLRLEAPTPQRKEMAEKAWHELVDENNQKSFRPSAFCRKFEDFLTVLGFKKCVVVLDEWVGIPREVQPHFSEMIKHTLLHSKTVCMKIASIDFHSMFSSSGPNDSLIGLEVGADIFADLEMDQFLIYDKNRPSVSTFFGAMLYNHLSPALTLPPISDDEKKTWIVRMCFSQENSFVELVRASEGVPRDFLHIFCRAYFDASGSYRPGSDAKINIQTVRKAAESWYLQDKEKGLREDHQLERLLQLLIAEVIGKHKARTFLVPQSLSRHRLLLKLVDARVIHLLRRGWSHPDKPGERYDIFSIDYGTYVSLINTDREPQLEFEEVVPSEIVRTEVVVPFDDFRSIRRIELRREVLDRAEAGASLETRQPWAGI